MTDYAADIERYATDVDTAAVAGIVKHLGIALLSADASHVSCSSRAERDRVRDSFLKRKLGLAQPDPELDAAVLDVCQMMNDDNSKARVTFYYLLALRFGKLAALH